MNCRTRRVGHSPVGHFPHLDTLVSWAGNDEISSGHKSDTRYVVIVAVHRFEAGKRLLEVPQLDGHVRTARHCNPTIAHRQTDRQTLKARPGRGAGASRERVGDLPSSLPLGSKAISCTESVCPFNVRSYSPVSKSQTFMDASSLADTIKLNTGWKITWNKYDAVRAHT